MVVEILVCIGLVVGVVLLIALITRESSLILDYIVLLEGKAVKLSFKQLMSYYNIAPQKWVLDKTTIFYSTTATNINLNFIDYIKFRIFIKSKNKAKKAQAVRKDTIVFLESIQKDIDKYKAQTQKEQNEAINNIARIIHGYDGSWRIE